MYFFGILKVKIKEKKNYLRTYTKTDSECRKTSGFLSF